MPLDTPISLSDDEKMAKDDRPKAQQHTGGNRFGSDDELDWGKCLHAFRIVRWVPMQGFDRIRELKAHKHAAVGQCMQRRIGCHPAIIFSPRSIFLSHTSAYILSKYFRLVSEKLLPIECAAWQLSTMHQGNKLS